jgi:glycosyltransferase involved in cell wall biosynthesis
MAKRLSPREFVWLVFICTVSWLGLGILAELSLATFRPWEEGYRFAGIFHPNDMGFNSALLIMSAVYLSRDLKRGRALLWLVLAIAVLFLFLTRSRTSLGCTVVALTASWLVAANPRRVLIGAGVAIWCAILLGAVFGEKLAEMASEAVVLGRVDDDMTSLTGRLPLWADLLEYAAERPLTGYGYNGFWTAERMREVAYSQTWAVSIGHSSYIDLLLSVGLIGVVLCLTAMFIAVGRAIVLERKLPRVGYGFMAMILGYTLIGGISETTIGITWFASLFGIGGMCYLTFEDARAPWRQSSNSSQSRSTQYARKERSVKEHAMIQDDSERLSVTVIIPTYNHAPFVRAAVESALNQSRVPDEIIIVDDGSTDNTEEVLSQFTWPVRVIRQENRGRSAARNAGLRAANSDLIVFLDSDDTLVYDSIERRARMFEADRELGVVYGDMFVVNAAGQKFGVHSECMPGVRPSGFILPELALRCFILMPAMVRRRAIGENTFDETLSRAEDYDFWRRIAGDFRFKYTDKPIACYRMHESNTVTSQPTAMLEAELEIQRRIFVMPQFSKLRRHQRGRVYCNHGVKCAVLGHTKAARRALAKAAWTDPLAVENHVLFLFELFTPRLLSWIVLARRRRTRKQLGTLATSGLPSNSQTEESLQRT